MKTIRELPFALKLLGVTAVHALLAKLALSFFSLDNVVGIFWPPSGWALAVLLTGGNRYAWGVFAGAFAGNLMAGAPLPSAVFGGMGSSIAALLGSWLLMRDARFSIELRTLRDFGQLIFKAAIVATGASALLGTSSMTAFGTLTAENYLPNLFHWWGGDALGIMLLMPLVLIWRHPPDWLQQIRRWLEAFLLLGLTALLGQVVFLGWLPDVLPLFPRKGYWLFPLIICAAARLGPHGVIALLLVASTQAMIGVGNNVAFFANPQVEISLIDSWFFITTLTLVGMAVATYLQHRRNAEQDQRIAAIAFECQEGMIITDAQMRILRTNHSFSRIMGYSEAEVLGQSTAFMRSDRHPDSFYEAAWETARSQASWHSEVWHKRKNGEVFPQWLTATAVKNEQGEITNFVVTHTDITRSKQEEARRLHAEASHRNALVREVHHRIKNSLQGITGLLRQFIRSHPQTEEPISQAISLVKSIAVLHGLQGSSSTELVRLCELTRAIAQDAQSVWKTPISVDIPELWAPCTITLSETVPVALVINELMVNAIKHGGKLNGHVGVTLSKGARPDIVRLLISNEGQLATAAAETGVQQTGLQLVHSLMPREGARLTQEQFDRHVLTCLELTTPVITLEESRQHANA